MSVDALPCGVLDYDDDLRIVRANAAAAHLLGYGLRELEGRAVAEVLSRATLIFFNMHVHPSLALIGRLDELYVRLRTRSGEDLPVLLCGARREETERPLNTLTFLTMRRRTLREEDLVAARHAAQTAEASERRATELAEHARAQLAFKERLASLGTLAHGVAHEVNTPLTYIKGNLELVHEALQGGDELDRSDLADLVGQAMEGADRIAAIVGQVAQLARADEMPAVRLDPRSVADLVVRMTKVQTRGRGRVELTIDDVPHVQGDAGRLGQVLVNLVLNAIQAFGDRPASENLLRIVTRTAANGSAVLEVTDNGPGIPPEVAARIFEPFFTTKPAGEGSGLGLAISRDLVTSLGGTLEVESEQGHGATFRVTLPAHAPATATATANARVRVLVVDEDEQVARTIARVLGRYEVTTAHSTDEALDRIERQPPIDVVFTELHMTGPDGRVLHAAIAERFPSLASRVAFVTGALSDEERADLELTGLPVYVKPVTVAGFQAFCNRVLGVSAPAPSARRSPPGDGTTPGPRRS